jgi:undecaprenyl-diphosphatase
MDLLTAIILGIVQGLTEFIPVSSSAHMVFVARLTNMYGGNPEDITATMAVVQLGTLAAVLVYFAADLWNIGISFIRDHVALISGGNGRRFSGTDGVRPMWLSEEAWLGWLIIIGSVPIGVLGLLFKHAIEGPGTKNLWTIAIMLISVAILLSIAEMVGSQRKDLSHLGFLDAIIMGFAQCLALMPGASRSGSTIMGGLFAGQKRETAARFSFLLSIPAVTASGLLELKEAWTILPKDSFVPLIVSTIVAAVVGYGAIWALLAYLKRNSTAIFIVYRVIFGIVLLVLLWRGVISPAVN